MHQRSSDSILLFVTRSVRLFGYGALSVVLAFYLAELGFGKERIGLLLSLTLVGDAAISLWLTTWADRIGRRKALLVGSLLMAGAGIVFILSHNPIVLMVAAIIGVISPGGGEIGPFLPVEQAALSQLLPDTRRTQGFAWYNLVGSMATALGALLGGLLARALQDAGWATVDAYRAVVVGYAACGVVLALLFACMSSRVEVVAVAAAAPRAQRSFLGLHRSRPIVIKLAALFAFDSFSGALIMQSLVAYWYNLRFGLDVAQLGGLFFAVNLLAAFSALLAVRLADRIGLVRTMVFTHIPANILLCLQALMPSAPLAVGLHLIRSLMSQMDRPTRESYTVAVVAPDERSAAQGVIGFARSVASVFSPYLTGLFLSAPALINVPFLLTGGLKIAYDLLLYQSFRDIRPPEEQ